MMNRRESVSSARFGTFGGVFTPCTLTILGVIMFLRFGEVVGNAGILRSLLILGMAKLITILTALSLSSAATNTRVKGGGAYYLISRALGIEFGGAIGIVFYLSQAASVALYVLGFTEALLTVFPAWAAAPRQVASIVNVLVFVCVYIGAGWTIRVQYAILATLIVAIFSFVGGALRGWDSALLAANWGADYESGQNFWSMFALFFPAVTGIMAGANMSGDLKAPGRSIPRGTLASIAFTGVVYAVFAVLLGACASRQALRMDTMIVADRALFPSLIVAGVFAATLSSALGSMMGAPRILQALARDKVLTLLSPFAKGSGAAGEPRRATILSFVIAQAGIMLGDLNAIAPVITMFFMITYGAINFATFVESYSRNPSYRPTFRWCHWTMSLAGALFCAVVMLLINAVWAVVAVLIMIGIYRYLLRQELEASWGDVVSGAVFERARRNLLMLEEERYHARNWRPSILAMGGANEDRLHLAVLAKRMAGSRGLLILGQVFVGNPDELLDRHTAAHRMMRKMIVDNELEAFPAVTVAPGLTDGISSLVQCCGVGALRPNMVWFGWNRERGRRGEFEANLRTVVRLGRSMGVLRVNSVPDDPWEEPPGSLDVWWHGPRENGHLMLLLAHLLRSQPDVRGHRLRLLRMVASEAGQAETLAHLEAMAHDVRIECECRVVIGREFAPTLQQESGAASLVFLGMADPRGLPDGFADGLDKTAGALRRVLFVYSAGDMSLNA